MPQPKLQRERPLPPGSMIGVLGGGQLGRMLALAAARLGFDVTILEPEPESPASRVAARTLEAPYDDREALKTLAATCDVVTFEFENVPAAVVEQLETLGALAAPGKRALAIAQDRVDEKEFFRTLDVATAEFAAIAGPDDIRAALPRLGGRALLKIRREGYDEQGPDPGSKTRPTPLPRGSGSGPSRRSWKPACPSCANCR